MSLYPTLEDMKVDQMMKAQAAKAPQPSVGPPVGQPLPYPRQNNMPFAIDKGHQLYPGLDDYMGLSLTSDEMAMVTVPQNHIAVVGQSGAVTNMVAPLSANSLGLKRAEITHGLREVTLCKDNSGKVGLRVKDINKGVFVVLVHANSPASMVGLRFGDQILQINEETVAGYSTDKVHNMFKKCGANGIQVVVRDRPFERTLTLHKDSVGHTGFAFKNGKITNIVKDSSAARNGLLIDHQLLEVNGQNVVGLDDKVVRNIIESGGDIVTLTLMPSFVYEHMMKQMASSLVKKVMDHSVPDI